MLVLIYDGGHWNFQDGRIIIYSSQSLVCVDDEEAKLMIEKGFAEEIDQSEQQGENNDRISFWKQFSRSDLQELCKNHVHNYKPSLHRNIDSLIELIIEHEQNHDYILRA